MKKLYVTVVAVALIGATSLFLNQIDHTKSSSVNAVTPKSTANEHIFVEEGQYLFRINTLGELVENADNIIIGKMLSSELIDNMGTRRYEFLVIRELKGAVSTKTIDVYANDGTYEEGNKYLLFLESDNIEIYPRTIYVSVSQEVVINLSKKSIEGETKSLLAKNLGKKLIDENDFISTITKLPQNKIFKHVVKPVKEKSKDKKERVQNANTVILITPTAINFENKNAKIVKFNLEKVFKGKINQNQPFALPASVELGKKYLVFLNIDEDGTYKLSTREDSVVEVNETSDLDSLTSTE